MFDGVSINEAMNKEVRKVSKRWLLTILCFPIARNDHKCVLAFQYPPCASAPLR